MNKVSFLIIVSLVTVFLSIPAFSAQVDNLYVGKVMVPDKTQKNRVKAHRWAIEQVIAKVSGDRKVLDNRKIKQAVAFRAANYIRSFTFTTDNQGRTFLIDVFDQEKIDALLRSVGAAIWGPRRPSTLVWFALEEGINRSVIAQDSHPQLKEFLLQTADNRGLPIMLPRYDEQDQQAVFVSDIWGQFEQVIFSGSKRYQPDTILLAKIREIHPELDSELQPGWVLNFSLFSEQQLILEQQLNGEQFTIIREMMTQIGDYFASQYAIKSESVISDDIVLTINNVSNIVMLTAVEQALAELPAINSVELEKMANKSALFSAKLTGTVDDVKRALALLDEFSIVEQVQQVETKTVSVEEQLQQLSQSYLQQIDGQQSVATANSNKPQHHKLTYNWLGN